MVTPTHESRRSANPRDHVGRAPPAIRICTHPCIACGERTTATWFCVACRARARPHEDGDPYDDLGGEAA